MDVRSQKFRSFLGNEGWICPVVRRTSGARGRAIWDILAASSGLVLLRRVMVDMVEFVVYLVWGLRFVGW